MITTLFTYSLLVRSNCFASLQRNHFHSRLEKHKMYSDGAKRLDLAWDIYEAIENCDITEIESCCYKCSLCDGHGLLICNFCKGTGFLMLEDELIGTSNPCPVCRGTGEHRCKPCSGSGFIALWKQSD